MEDSIDEAMKLSVCIPVYKASGYIGVCAESLFGQTIDDAEFIFVDDCSPDDSVDILKRTLENYANLAPRVRIIRLEHNSGRSVARRTALRSAIGEYVGWCDPDDWVDRNYFASLVACAEEESADMVCAPIVREWDDGRTCMLRPDSYPSGVDMLLATCPSTLFNSFCNKIVRRTIAQSDNIRWQDGIGLGEDEIFQAQVARFVGKVAVCTTTCYHYRQHEESVTSALDDKARYHDRRLVADVLVDVLGGQEFGRVRDRVRRDALTAAIRAGTPSAEEYRCLRKELESPLLADARLDIAKRAALSVAELSYPVACWLSKLLIRLR